GNLEWQHADRMRSGFYGNPCGRLQPQARVELRVNLKTLAGERRGGLAGSVARATCRKTGPSIVGKTVVMLGQASGDELIARPRIIEKIEIAQAFSRDGGEQQSRPERRRGQQIPGEPQLESRCYVEQRLIPLPGEKRTLFLGLSPALPAHDLIQQLVPGSVGEQQQPARKVFVQIRRLSEFGQALPLAAIRRQEEHFAVATLDVSRKHRGPSLAANRFRENKIAVVEIEAEILFHQAHVADAIALGCVQAGGMQDLDQVRAVACSEESSQKTEDRSQNSPPSHLHFVHSVF